MTNPASRHPALRRTADAGTCRVAHLCTAWISGFLLLLAAFALPLPGVAQTGAAAAPAGTQAQAPPVAQTGARRVDAVEVELVADVARAAPGERFRLGLRLRHDPGWHTYWRNPGDSGLPTRFEPVGPAGTSYGDITWPAPQRLAIGGLANYGYEGTVLLSRQVTLPDSTAAPVARFEVLAQWLVCKEVCIPGEAAVALELPVAAPVEKAAAGVIGLFDESAARAPDPLAAARAGWSQQAGRAYLLLPEAVNASRAEFFPYFEGRIRPAAPQTLVEVAAVAQGAVAASAVRRLALRLETTEAIPQTGVASRQEAQGSAAQPAADKTPATPPALPQPASGLLVVDGKPLEVSLDLLPAEPVSGRVISVAEVVPPAPSGAGGLLARLRGAASSPPPSASASALSAPEGVARAFPSPAVGATAQSLVIALGAALLGGLLLNLMPCVFPVIGLKVLSFSQSAGGEPGRARLHAVAFSGGVVLSFLALGLALLALRSAGEAAGWGFQMQSPVFVGAMTLLFVLIALNLSGVFETGMSLTRLPLDGNPLRRRQESESGETRGSSGETRHGLWRSFGTGVVAVLVATPCTAPFMGSAVGYTITSPAFQTLMVFGALGIGMAAPYLLLGSAPGLLRRLPRPGPWLLVFKQLLAFPMLATAAWLAWVLTLQAGADGLLRLLMSAVLIAFGAWLYGRAQVAHYAGRSRWLPLSLAGGAAVLTVWHLAQLASLAPVSDPLVEAGAPAPYRQARPDSQPPAATSAGPAQGRPGGEADRLDGGGDTAQSASGGWRSWSAQKVSQALSEGRPVVVDFTAAWCISCQVNKKLVLDREVVRNAFDASSAVLLRADWTSRDPAITAELARFGRNGVPLYLVYVGADEPPLMLPELLTVDIVLAALAQGR